MTEAEVLLWNALRGRKCNGLKFRRQVPIAWYVVDFLCMEKSLVIEVDGGIHDEQITNNLSYVLKRISEAPLSWQGPACR